MLTVLVYRNGESWRCESAEGKGPYGHLFNDHELISSSQSLMIRTSHQAASAHQNQILEKTPDSATCKTNDLALQCHQEIFGGDSNCVYFWDF